MNDQRTSGPICAETVPARTPAIDRLRAAGRMTAADEAHHVRLFIRPLERGNEKARTLMGR